ncbi:MAG: hypothetical protein A2015_03100 [Spirochaetes bacterium GWF1_31_7]|nr:MAG: hypothetical protein A2Y30_16560 [Spirochaetes bacterium GWE1_32_154]OHD45305.1 MAG: hypothetical protein A2Y29_08240 [Spirochaetes bacterium GWE2_31_10]OHD50955.1 MAG: hypothetical protein A2015_03100 [Spirochaetes bacterium GWF1_31_7]OHD78667.1 MAG: hypothetical protein A2355_18110 [Spirochaetes bacterium RIFOXYB1_FULL_32_8]HBD95581.1 hypothetical protein [Spirochaetia bacterium]
MKIIIFMTAFFIPVIFFSNEITTLTTGIDFSISNDSVDYKTGKNKRSKTYSALTKSFMGHLLIIYSVPMSVLSGFLIYHMPGLYYPTAGLINQYQEDKEPLTHALAGLMLMIFVPALLGTITLSLASMVLLSGGLALSIIGAIQLKNSPMAHYVDKRNKFLSYTALITGLFSLAGSISGGVGASLLVFNHFNENTVELNDAGIKLSVIGAIGLFSLPVTITSLSHIAWLRGVKARFGMDGGINKADSFYVSFNVQF